MRWQECLIAVMGDGLPAAMRGLSGPCPCDVANIQVVRSDHMKVWEGRPKDQHFLGSQTLDRRRGVVRIGSASPSCGSFPPTHNSDCPLRLGDSYLIRQDRWTKQTHRIDASRPRIFGVPALDARLPCDAILGLLLSDWESWGSQAGCLYCRRLSVTVISFQFKVCDRGEQPWC